MATAASPRCSRSGSSRSTGRSRRTRSRRPSSGRWRRLFADVEEQQEAKRLLVAALAEGPAHAYLFHGPQGVGKRRTALAFAGELLGDQGRVEPAGRPPLHPALPPPGPIPV